MNEIYSTIKDFITTAITDIGSTGIEDTDIRLEVVPSTDEWTGIRLMKIPSVTAVKSFINGEVEGEFNLQLVSKQSVKDTASDKMTYADFLDTLGAKLKTNFRSKRPELSGVKFKRIEINSNATLFFTDGEYSAYALDVKFIYQA